MKSKIVNIVFLVVILISLPLTVYFVGSQTSFLKRAYFGLYGSKANLVINLASPTTTGSYPWSNLSQGGEQKNGMLTEVIDEMRLLEPTYVRIDHVYDFYDTVKISASGSLEYNWTGLDREISAIIQSGAKPFISLSYMPSAISSGNEVDIPKDWILWKDVVKNTIQHISGKNGLAIEDAYYEVWNEPDLFGDYKFYGRKNYLTMYKLAAEAASSTVNTYPFKIGGPSVASLSKDWLNGFLDYVDRYGLRLDFYSWHQYSKDVNSFEENYIKSKGWLENYPNYKEIELIISEYGYDSEVNPDNDKEISAIHNIAANIVFNNGVDKAFHFEVKDGPGDKKYWGRWGILTNEKFGIPERKPRYDSILFLNKMKGNTYPVYGQGTWVKSIATSKNAIIRLLIVNYDPYGKHYENVPLHFVKVPYKNFVLRKLEFGGKTTESRVSLSDDNWNTSQLMIPNSAIILEMIPRVGI